MYEMNTLNTYHIASKDAIWSKSVTYACIIGYQRTSADEKVDYICCE